MARTDVIIASTSRKVDKAIKSIKKHNIEIGQYIGNDAQSVEEYFYQTLAGDLKLGGVEYDKVERNVTKNENTVEFDLVLFNGDTIAIVEVNMVSNDALIKNAKRKGIYLLTQQGDKLAYLKDQVTVY